ncbi:MAG: hypothetical protein JSU93_06640 [Methanobacteriota archaeon]|nr:MAG: hypothetical protein JSU93_06640 [Euryarchaeota archaeon]
MQGVSGTFGAEDKELIMRMLERLRHRGPDGSSVHAANDTVLGAVCKTPSSGRIVDAIAEKDGVAVASDSYIFNKPELVRAFASDSDLNISDQELLLAMYSELGANMFGYIDGAYATAIVDGKSTILARDGYGLKPLYLSGDEMSGVFSSEIKSQMVASDRFIPFPPGTVMVKDHGMEAIHPINLSAEGGGSKGGGVEELRQMLVDSTRKSLDGGDGFNILLSGGVDSTAIAAAASQITDDLETVCVGFEGGADAGMAQKVADDLGTDHHEKSYDADEMLDVLDDVIYAAETFDFPLVRSCIPNYIATHQFGDKSRITLCGEGGDEVFAGYDYMRDIESDEALRRERINLLKGGYLTGFQRVDRMTSSASLDGRMPIMSKGVVNLGLGMSRQAVLGRSITESKLALRKAFSYMLPEEVVWRKKMRFSDGAGSLKALVDVANKAISDEEFERERRAVPGDRIRTKEELLYYRSFIKHFDSESAVKAVGFTPRP